MASFRRNWARSINANMMVSSCRIKDCRTDARLNCGPLPPGDEAICNIDCWLRMRCVGESAKPRQVSVEKTNSDCVVRRSIWAPLLSRRPVAAAAPQCSSSQKVSRRSRFAFPNTGWAHDEAQGREASVSQDCGLNSPRNFAPRFCPVF